MLPPELQGGDPNAAGGGLPPELPPEAIMQMIGGGGGAPPMGGPPMGGPPPEDAAAPRDTLSILDEMLALAKEYIDTDEDEEDKHTMTKVLMTLQKYLADEQKEQQDAMSGKFSPKVMSRAYGG